MVWGPYGFYDAFSETHNWYPKKYLAIDQGSIVVMMRIIGAVFYGSYYELT